MSKLITFKTAVLAKEKDFPQNSFNASWYNEFGDKNGRTDLNKEGKTYNEVYNSYSMFIPLEHKEEFKTEAFLAPTQSELQMWLLENHGLFVSVVLAYDEWGKFVGNVQECGKHGKAILAQDGFSIFNNQFDAMEEALEEALKLLP
jgi:hypothetical protein